MKALKITLLVAVLATAFASCTEQDLNDDEILGNDEATSAYYTGGDIDE
ncbi:hypothetical protein [Algibacter sp. Ld11]